MASLKIIKLYLELIIMLLLSSSAIQFVLSDEFTHMRPEERQQLLHVSVLIFIV